MQPPSKVTYSNRIEDDVILFYIYVCIYKEELCYSIINPLNETKIM